MRETSLGLIPDLTGTRHLLEAVGYGRALEICATGRWVSAQEAFDLRLATTVVAPDALDPAVEELVTVLLAAPASALRATKAVLRASASADHVAQRIIERETQIPLLRGLMGQTS